MAGPPNNHDRRRNSEFQISEFKNHKQSINRIHHLSEKLNHAYFLVLNLVTTGIESLRGFARTSHFQ